MIACGCFINPEATRRIGNHAHESGARVRGRIRYDSTVMPARIRKCTVIDIDTHAAGNVRGIY
jgi:hypothetical protein